MSSQLPWTSRITPLASVPPSSINGVHEYPSRYLFISSIFWASKCSCRDLLYLLQASRPSACFPGPSAGRWVHRRYPQQDVGDTLFPTFKRQYNDPYRVSSALRTKLQPSPVVSGLAGTPANSCHYVGFRWATRRGEDVQSPVFI